MCDEVWGTTTLKPTCSVGGVFEFDSEDEHRECETTSCSTGEVFEHVSVFACRGCAREMIAWCSSRPVDVGKGVALHGSSRLAAYIGRRVRVSNGREWRGIPEAWLDTGTNRGELGRNLWLDCDDCERMPLELELECVGAAGFREA